MTVLPLSLIPTFLVPLFLMFHVICIAEARTWKDSSGDCAWNAGDGPMPGSVAGD